MKKTNIAYTRKSSESEERQVLSIPAQVAELRTLAERRGEHVDLLLEESRSAREPGRPVFGTLLKMIERGEVETIYAWRLDRLARNPVDGAYLIHHLGHGRIRQIVTPEGVFSGTGNDKLLMQIHFGMATKYVDDLSENVKRGNREVLKSGRVPGQVPLGYQKAPQVGKGARETEIDPERFPLIQDLWRRLLTGSYTVNELVRLAAKAELSIRQSRKHVSYNGLLKLFRNPFYCGTIVRGGRAYVGTHPSAITQDEFDRAQFLLRRTDARRPVRHLFLFSGLARCGSCGRAAVGEEHWNRRYGFRYVYYRCSKRGWSASPRCREPYVTETEIARSVSAAVNRLEAKRDLMLWAAEDVERVAAEKKDSVGVSISALQNRKGTLETELARLTDLVVRRVLSEEEYLARKDQANRELATVQSRLADPSDLIEQWKDRIKSALNLALTVGETLRGGDIRTKREVLGLMVESIVVKDRQAQVCLKAPFSILVSAEIAEKSELLPCLEG